MTVPFRVGQGLDVHAFSDDPDRPLVLGGVVVPGGPGLAGHSDADVVLHAIVDALLGAAGLGDIGSRFGSARPEYARADSSVFVREALRLLAAGGWSIGNVDCSLVAARPRLAQHREAMLVRVAGLLGVEPAQASVKATTTDGLGWTGRGEGIACLAVVLLSRDPVR
ncbi:MAG: 2-C-methyl-D-erythritol 2,4-cyclodiphosphate synthase [Nitriliruptorales bacterium]|nr:2-C-methyl-D-erythritol 2,4-cyclodiphosphate synthase [Nitriliruptorales bacterium]